MHSDWLRMFSQSKYFHCRSPLYSILAAAEKKNQNHYYSLAQSHHHKISIDTRRERGECVWTFSLLVGWLWLGAKCERAKILFRGSPSFHSLSTDLLWTTSSRVRPRKYLPTEILGYVRAQCLGSCVQFLSYSHRHWRCRKEQIGMKKKYISSR